MVIQESDFVVVGDADIHECDEPKIRPLVPEEIERIQQWLEPSQYSGASSQYGKHLASHLAGTGQWIQHTSQYQDWLDGTKGLLWICGNAGTGKSTIAATLISQLMEQESVPVLYFFYRSTISANRTPSQLVRDYLSQLLKHSPTLQATLIKFVDSKESLGAIPFQELWQTLLDHLECLSQTYCIVDAVDEMEMDKRNEFMHLIVQLATKRPMNIKVIVTSRPEPNIDSRLGLLKCNPIRLYSKVAEKDVSAYIEHRLGNLQLTSTHRTKLHARICEKAQGHFLYARLLIDSVSTFAENRSDQPGGEDKVLSAVDNLPAALADLYTDMLLKHSKQVQIPLQSQIELVQWVTRAERPVRLLELTEICEIVPLRNLETGDGSPKHIIRQACGPLLEILVDETVHPIHHSFVEYLYDTNSRHRNSDRLNYLVLDDCHTHRGLALKCLTYLTNGWHHDWENADECDEWFDREAVQKLKLKYPILEYTARYWPRHLRKSDAKDTDVLDALDNLLCKDSSLLFAWLRLSTDVDTYDGNAGYTRSEVLKTWKPLHVAADQNLAFYAAYLIKKGHDVECQTLQDQRALTIAACKGHVDVVRLLLATSAQSDEEDDVGLKPIHYATLHNHHQVAELLLEAGVSPYTEKTRGDYDMSNIRKVHTAGNTPVQYASSLRQEEVFKAFIPFFDSDGLQRALHWTIRERWSSMATHLLQHPTIDVNYVVDDQTPLYLASKIRDLNIMRQLLAMGAEPNSLSSNQIHDREDWENENDEYLSYSRMESPLHVFINDRDDRFDHQKMDFADMKTGILMLADAGCELNLGDFRGYTILHRIVSRPACLRSSALYHDVKDILDFLLARGLSPFALASNGSNALHVACNVSAEVIGLLIDRGIDIDQKRSSDGITPLFAACDRRDTSLGETLLARGANVNLTSDNGRTILHSYCWKEETDENLSMMKILLEAGVNPNMRSRNGDTPLHRCSIKPKFFALFLKYGFDSEARDNSGRTIFHRQASRPRTVAELQELIELGANPFTRDSIGGTCLHTLLADEYFDAHRAPQFIRYFKELGLSMMSKDDAGNTFLHVIAKQKPWRNRKEQIDLMKLFVELGCSPSVANNIGQLPLHTSVSFSLRQQSRTKELHGVTEALLAELMADVNAVDLDGIRPIHMTASHDNYQTCRLLEFGADPMLLTCEGQSPLMIACRNRECDIVCMLLDHYRKHGLLSHVDQVDQMGNSALHYACKSGRPEIVAMLLRAGADVNLKNTNGFSPLRMCAESLVEQSVWKRTSEGSEFSAVRHANNILLSKPAAKIVAYCQDDPIRVRETIRLLIQYDADTKFLMEYPGCSCSLSLQRIGLGGQDSKNALIAAILCGHNAMMDELITIQKSLLHNDIISEHVPVTSTYGCKHQLRGVAGIEDAWDKLLETHHSRVDLLKLRYVPDIVSEMFEPGTSNMEVVRALLREDNEPCVRQLGKLGAKFTSLDADGFTALHRMAAWGFGDLLRHFGDDVVHLTSKWIAENAPRKYLNTILKTAIDRTIPNLEVVRLLVDELKMNPNDLFPTCDTREPETTSILHDLARPRHWWHIEALEMCLQNGGNVELRNSAGETPLLAAVRREHGVTYLPWQLRALQILLKHGANPNVLDNEGMTCLNLASNQTHYVDLFLQNGADISLGNRPFIFDVILRADIDLMRMILKTGINVNCPPRKSLMYASDREKGAPKKWSDHFSPEELCNFAYPLHVAAAVAMSSTHLMVGTDEEYQSRKAIVDMLIEVGADPLITYDDGSTILHVLLENGGFVENMIQSVKSNTERRAGLGRTFLMCLCSNERIHFDDTYIRLADILLAQGASPNAVDYEGRTALHYWVRSFTAQGRSRIPNIQRIIPTHLHPLLNLPDKYGRTAWHYVVAKPHLDLFDAFLSQDVVDVTVPDPLDRSTALHHFAPRLTDHNDILLHDPEAIVVSDGYLERNAKNSQGPIDTRKPEPAILLQLYYSTVTTPENHHQAESISPRRHFRTLLKRGLHINAVDAHGETPLFKLMETEFYGTSHNNKYVTDTGLLFSALRFMLEIGADATKRNDAGQSVLHRIAMRCDPDMGMYGVEWGEHRYEDFRKCVRMLVERGADVAWEDSDHRTCLDVAAASGATWMVDMYKRE